MNELRQYPNWVNWNIDKKPLIARSGLNASSTNPEHWCDYETASTTGLGLGFVLTHSPFCVVDFDATGDPLALSFQAWAYGYLASASEISPSEAGCHTWIRADLTKGRKFPKLKTEFYSDARYITVTGNLLNDTPIEDRQQQVEDCIIVAECWTNKFAALWANDSSEYANDVSAGDQAMLNMLAKHTQDTQRITRLFAASERGKRKKASRSDYIERSIEKAIGGINSVVIDLDSEPEPESEIEHKSSIPFPPGLMGHLAQYIYNSGQRQVPEVAIAGAIAYMAGICGKAWSVNGSGLNQYVIVLADSGYGKDTASKAIRTLHRGIAPGSSFLGPGYFASPQALAKQFPQTPSFVSLQGEAGKWLASMSDRFASSNDKGMMRLLLTLYTTADTGQSSDAMIYSDGKNNVEGVKGAAYSFLGDSTQDSFYRSMTPEAIQDGLLSRLTVLEADCSKEPPYNPDSHKTRMDADAAVKLKTLITLAHENIQRGKQVEVEFDASAYTMQDEFRQYTSEFTYHKADKIFRPLWNRAHLKVLRLAALVAIGDGGTITSAHVTWAAQIIVDGITKMQRRFETGDVGESAGRESSTEVVEKCLAQYLKKVPATSYKVPLWMWPARVVPYRYIQNLTRRCNMGRMSLREVMDELEKTGVVRKITSAPAGQVLKGVAYQIE